MVRRSLYGAGGRPNVRSVIDCGVVSRIPPQLKIKKDPETNNICCACLIFARIGGGRQSHRYCRGSKQRPLRVQLIFSVTFTPLAPFALHFDTYIKQWLPATSTTGSSDCGVPRVRGHWERLASCSSMPPRAGRRRSRTWVSASCVVLGLVRVRHLLFCLAAHIHL